VTAYLDHAATTPLVDEAYEAVTRALRAVGNPSSLHGPGRQGRRLVEESRETVAAVLGARPSEVVFTGGGTESDNLAIKGLFWSRRATEPARSRIVASAVEHHAVLDAITWLGDAEGARVTWVAVDALGRVRPDALAAALAADGGPDNVALVSVMWANNEVGTINDIPALAALARAEGVPFHTDAVQAVGQLAVDFAACGADALTVSGHKVGGPVGVGAAATCAAGRSTWRASPASPRRSMSCGATALRARSR
jgi:cysteine desulfurase